MFSDDHATLLANLRRRVDSMQREMIELSQESEALSIQATRSIESVRYTLDASRRVLAEAYTAIAQYPRASYSGEQKV